MYLFLEKRLYIAVLLHIELSCRVLIILEIIIKVVYLIPENSVGVAKLSLAHTLQPVVQRTSHRNLANFATEKTPTPNHKNPHQFPCARSTDGSKSKKSPLKQYESKYVEGKSMPSPKSTGTVNSCTELGFHHLWSGLLSEYSQLE